LTAHYIFEKKSRIDTPRLFLRPMTEADADLVVSWRNILAQENHSVFLNREKLSIKNHLTWFKNQRSNRIDYIFCKKSEGNPIGTVHFKKIDKLRGIAEAGKIIGDFSYRKKGLAKEAFAVWLKFGFEDLKLNKIYALTDINNITNINLNLKLGFKAIQEKKKINFLNKDFLKMEISKDSVYKLNKILDI